MRLVVLDTDRLLPAAWRRLSGSKPVRAFNPSLLRDGATWILAYRVVFEPDQRRRIALCRLDENFNPVDGSAVAFSEGIVFPAELNLSGPAIEWFADPRLYRLRGHAYIYWNSGWHEPQNHQFLQRFDPTALRPIASAQELRLSPRQKLEKNWGLFQSGDAVFAVYSVNPHRILRVALNGSPFIETETAYEPVANPGGYARVHGGLRGGAPPQLQGQHYYSFCHSIEYDESGYRYDIAAYRFTREAPFAPTDMPTTPLALSLPSEARRHYPKLNPAVGSVLYPAGAAYDAGHWVLSFGIDDERCAIGLFAEDEILRTLEPVGDQPGNGASA